MTINRLRKLDDADLDSGDVDCRKDRVRAPETVGEEGEQYTFVVMNADIS
jgi:hypothetical protein